MPWQVVHRCEEDGPPRKYVVVKEGDKVRLACAACGETLQLERDGLTPEKEQA